MISDLLDCFTLGKHRHTVICQHRHKSLAHFLTYYMYSIVQNWSKQNAWFSFLFSWTFQWRFTWKFARNFTACWAIIYWKKREISMNFQYLLSQGKFRNTNNISPANTRNFSTHWMTAQQCLRAKFSLWLIWSNSFYLFIYSFI